MFSASDRLSILGLPLLLPCDCCSSPGAGVVGSLRVRLFMRLDRLRSRPWLLRAGDAPLGERCRPALIVAAACSEDKDGDLGEGGLLANTFALVTDILLGREDCGELEVEGGSIFRSGGISDCGATRAFVEEERCMLLRES